MIRRLMSRTGKESCSCEGRFRPLTNALHVASPCSAALHHLRMPKSKQWRNGSAGTAANGMASIATRRKTRMTHGIMPVRFPASMRNISDRPRNYSHWHGGR